MTKLIPTGECWCGCGQEASRGAFFAPGHDKTAESAVIKVDYGTVPDFLKAHGYGPDGKNPSQELAKFKKRGGEYL
jgi:hypothetical protein